MKHSIFSLIIMFVLVCISCVDQIDLTKGEPEEENFDDTGIQKGELGVASGSCGGTFSGTYSVINQYYMYSNRTLDVSCAAMGATITVSVNALDVPNRFTIRDASNNIVGGTSWRGYASYPGPWGSSLSVSGSTSFSFVKNSTSYYLQVETQTPPNYSYYPTTDYWDVTVSCTCTGGGGGECSPTCAAGYTCTGGSCVCTTTCGGNFSGNYSTINSFYIYPQQSFSVLCASNGATISVSCSALDVPNKFTIRDASNNVVVYSNWLGNASYPGPWGMSLSNSGTATLTFTKATGATTYYLQVETLTPPNYNYSPTTDYWSTTISCP